MIIDNAAVKMQSDHHQQQRIRREETFEITRNRPELKVEPSNKDHLKLSKAGKAIGTQKNKVDLDRQPGAIHSLTMQIVRRMVKEITGQELNVFSPDELQGKVDEVTYQEPIQAPTRATDNSDGLIYQRSMSYFESETMSFNAEGNIATKDGRNIAFSVSLFMSRSFYVESNLSVRTGNEAKTDPLVINFEGNAAELTTTHFEFDIDANGSLDQIAMLKSGSGMLALDKNQDGVINDGSELFGPRTGNGFDELAAYDEDNNQFIDEADSIYKQLRIWLRHGDGSQQLMALGEKNVGAIYLGHLTTPFQLKDEINASLGEVASSGIYLTEQGSVGTIQQINFTA